MAKVDVVDSHDRGTEEPASGWKEKERGGDARSLARSEREKKSRPETEAIKRRRRRRRGSDEPGRDGRKKKNEEDETIFCHRCYVRTQHVQEPVIISEKKTFIIHSFLFPNNNKKRNEMTQNSNFCLKLFYTNKHKTDSIHFLQSPRVNQAAVVSFSISIPFARRTLQQLLGHVLYVRSVAISFLRETNAITIRILTAPG